MDRPRLILAAAVLSTLGPALRAQTSYPMLSRVEPTAVQRGTTVDLVISGTGTGSFAGASQMLCEQPGLEGRVVVDEPEKAKEKTAPDTSGKAMRPARSSVKARLTTASDAPLGPREIRVATPQGAS